MMLDEEAGETLGEPAAGTVIFCVRWDYRVNDATYAVGSDHQVSMATVSRPLQSKGEPASSAAIPSHD